MSESQGRERTWAAFWILYPQAFQIGHAVIDRRDRGKALRELTKKSADDSPFVQDLFRPCDDHDATAMARIEILHSRFACGFVVVAVVVFESVGLPFASAQTASPPAQAAPVVLPPAAIGLAAAPEELQRALDESVLPTSERELVAELAKRAGDIQQTIANGAFGQVWVPAMATKTVALVLETHSRSLPESERAGAITAIKQIVTSAWDLDTFGDLGNKEKIDAAYARLATAVSALKAAYARH